MKKTLTTALLISTAIPAYAESFQFLGSGRLFTNDSFGDRSDRWRSGSLSYSRLYGPSEYEDQKTYGLGELVEFRARTTLISPSNNEPTPGDRPYVGGLSAGALTYYKDASYTFSIGGEVTVIGPQTGISSLQQRFHNRFKMPLPPFIDQQLPDDVIFSVFAESRKKIDVSEMVSITPFIEAMAGEETLARAGFDVEYGTIKSDRFVSRDVTTGKLYPIMPTLNHGWSINIGADIGGVADSYFLPRNHRNVHKAFRHRIRAGAEYKFEGGTGIAYNATYLSPEFDGQPEGQVLGSITINLNWN